MNPDDGPLCGPHKSAGFAGEKAARVPGVRAFGGSNRLDWLFFRQTRKYCPNGGMAFADRVGWGTITVPPCAPPGGREPHG